jgi:HlyD family secretion protein
VADENETVVSYNLPVEIKKINVVQGEPIKVGDTLLLLYQSKLTSEINKISYILEELKAKKTKKTNRSRSEIKVLKAEQAARINQLSTEIKKLEAEYKLKKGLVANFKSMQGSVGNNQDTSIDFSNPLIIQIEELKKQIKMANEPSQVVIERLNDELSNNGDPLLDQVQLMTNELALLNDKKDELVVRAQINGVIGSVLFNEGEKVTPYDTIVTIHQSFPSYVKGYIHENLHGYVYIGQTVNLCSTTGKTTSTGVVTGIGSRIVEYPIRLTKSKEIVIWGKEVIIKLQDNNNFHLGDKIVISTPDSTPKNSLSLFLRSFFDQKGSGSK